MFNWFKKPSPEGNRELAKRVHRLEIRLGEIEDCVTGLEARHSKLSATMRGSLGGRPRKDGRPPGSVSERETEPETKDQFRARMQRAGLLTARVHQAAPQPSPGEASEPQEYEQ